MSKDLFSQQAAAYAQFRPTYPDELYSFLMSRVRARQRAWDCATGSGQVAQRLAAFFDQVEATDLSAQQLAQAPTLPNVRYQVSPAEQTPFPDQYFDLITVGQALHWFALDPFYAEARRVARPGAQLAVWTYGLLTIAPGIDAGVRYLYHEALGPYWDPERRHVEAGYATLPFPFADVEERSFNLEVSWTYAHLAGYLSSWSALRRYQNQEGTDPLPKALARIRTVWPEAQEKRVIFPISLRISTIKKGDA
ncbi:Methyltransferase domain-containing protein [Catalinimonas alkaloidigena]|uniref:Methyltransferase domain-containing protein n=1 Tax=Catalinimonas alkaloidigena TaxID=1075417 RepID=A0A1G9PK15_9BACT|nr:class I SAM-dependent methyltransferase [Catalinimonas alkaloidigena]SDL98465.1 Methyltransferase domain-containing protein [Catalinimonas alkaloidigena]